ncbi:MAG TPA: CotO family spore coat protein [Bacillota bacterium]
MGEGKFAQNPLLYIDQPNIKNPKARMQNHYVTQRKNGEPYRNGLQQKNRRQTFPQALRRPRYLRPSQSMNKGTIQADKSDEVVHRSADRHGERPKFKQMTLKERIEYFANTPQHIPKLRCKIKTSKRTYRGIVTDFNNDIVVIQHGEKQDSIPFADVKEVQMLGL